MATSPTMKIPGVYRQDAFPKPPPVLATGVPVFIGFSCPVDKSSSPTLLRITHWPQYIDQVQQHCHRFLLDSAIHGFFANGGELCYVLLADLSLASGMDNTLALALETVSTIPEADLICLPELWAVTQTPEEARRLQQLILNHCDRTNDCFALLDAPCVASLSDIDALCPDGLQGNNGALYGPWLKSEQGAQWLPPCGHVAGMIARCDRTYGVHRAPANLVIDDALDLSVGLSDADQHRLNPLAPSGGLNCLRSLTGRGIRVWGARTLSTDPLGRYISGRRLLITVGRWAALALADVAFEPNDFALWVRIEREFTVYLTGLAQQGALQGQTAEEAFFVKCDAETNPPEVRDQGQVVTLIGLAPAVPGEFIVVRLIHGDTGVTLTNS